MDLPGVLHVVGPMVLGATFGAAGWARWLRWHRRRMDARAAALAAAGADLFKTAEGTAAFVDVSLMDTYLAQRLVYFGWSEQDLRRLEPLVDAVNPRRVTEIFDAFYRVGQKSWPGRNPGQQVDWMLALLGSQDLDCTRNAVSVANAYIAAFGRELAPLACAAGVGPDEVRPPTGRAFDRPTLVAMAALRGRTGFSP